MPRNRRKMKRKVGSRGRVERTPKLTVKQDRKTGIVHQLEADTGVYVYRDPKTRLLLRSDTSDAGTKERSLHDGGMTEGERLVDGRYVRGTWAAAPGVFERVFVPMLKPADTAEGAAQRAAADQLRQLGHSAGLTPSMSALYGVRTSTATGRPPGVANRTEDSRDGVADAADALGAGIVWLLVTVIVFDLDIPPSRHIIVGPALLRYAEHLGLYRKPRAILAR